MIMMIVVLFFYVYCKSILSPKVSTAVFSFLLEVCSKVHENNLNFFNAFM